MSCSPIYTVWCDGPDCLDWADTGPAHTATRARREAKGVGWVRRREPNGTLVDLCPSCAARPIHATAEIERNHS